MKKIFVLLTLVAVLSITATVGAVIAASDGLASKKPIKAIHVDMGIPQKPDSTLVANGRIIVPTPNLLNKVSYWIKGCKSTQKMNDSVAYECSPKVAKKLMADGEAREDRIFQKHDLEADIQIGANSVWAMDPSITGVGVKVAILDTGVDSTHIELSNSIILTKSFVGVTVDEEGHGTHVSGIVTADGIYGIGDNYATGVAPDADLIVGKVCNSRGCRESSIIKGIEWAVAQGADVLNLSLGGGNYYGENCDGDPLAAKVNWAVDQGLVVVVSSGNDNAGVSSPACASKAIAVGAVNKIDERASFSSYGSALDLVAPGVSILSTYSCVAENNCGLYWNYAWMSGTSMAAPHVVGTAALILQKNPDYTVDDVKEALYNTAVDLGAMDWDQYYGHGRIDALAAVNYQRGCSSNSECNDINECTLDVCDVGVCFNTPVGDDTSCTGGICCGGTCSVPTCTGLGVECDDEESCTTDTCNDEGTCSASCNNNWPDCSSINDGCCGPDCNSISDADCSIEDPVCGDGYCAGVDLGENCHTCLEDCPIKMHPRRGLLRCCGNYECESGENVDICPVDCQ